MTTKISNSNRAFLLLLFAILTNHIHTQDLLLVWTTNNPGFSADNQIEIPAYPSLNYNYSVDWENDGTFDITGVTGSIRHSYSSPGTYTVRIRGTFPGLCFNNSPYSDRNKLIDIIQFGNIVWQRMDLAFYGCSNLRITASDTPNMTNVQSMRWAFAGCTVFNTDISTWNLSNVTDMSYMLRDAESFNQDLSTINFSNVQSMNQMLDRSGLSIEMYDLLLISLASQNVRPNITLGAAGLTYCNGEIARESLINNDGWTIFGDTKGTSNLRWTGTANDGNWSNAANWNYNMLPCPCNNVQIPAANGPINVSNQVTIRNLSLEEDIEIVLKPSAKLTVEEN